MNDMGRLIDIDDVKDLINGLDSLPWEEEVDDLFKSIPTAYDVEKVVAELEKGSYEEYCSCCEIVRLKDATDIVRKGGIDE